MAITFEKHDIEVMVDAGNIPQNKSGTIDCLEVVRTMVDCQELVETEKALEITLSGSIQKDRGVLESFMLFFSLTWDDNTNIPKIGGQNNGYGTNSLWLQFWQNPGQYTDLMFRVNLYRKELSGKQYELARGHGFLVFGKDIFGYTN